MLRTPFLASALLSLTALGALASQARADDLYISNFNTDSVLRVNATTGAVITTYTAAAVNGPQGLAVSADGSTLYVASSGRTGGNDTIVRFDTATGAVTGSFTLGSTTTNWTGLALSADGSTLYAVSRGPTGTTTGGAVVRIPTATFNTSTTLYSSLNRPEAVALAPGEGSLYVSIGGANVVQQRANAVGGAVTKTYGSAASLNDPNGLKVADAGASLYVANTFSNNVVKFDTASGAILNTYTLIGPAGNFTGIDQAPSGLLYVADSFNSRILTLDPSTGASAPFAVTGATLSSPTFLVYAVTPVPEPPFLLALLGAAGLGYRGIVRLRRRPTPAP